MSSEHSHHQPNNKSSQDKNFWFTVKGIVAFLFIAILMALLLSEHRAHVLGILLWVLILACPLMHIFMHHGGHDHEGHHHGESGDDDNQTQDKGE